MKVVVCTQKKLPVKTGLSKAKKQITISAGKKSAQNIILELAAEAYSYGHETLPRSRLSTGTGLAPKTVTNNLAKLKQKGLIEYPDSKSIKLTPEGVETVGSLAKHPTTNADRHDRIKENLKGKQTKLFDLLADGAIHNRNTIANELDFENQKQKGFVNLVGAMRSQGIIEYPDKQTVRLTDMCFPKGRD